jgi:predicted deacylase
MKNIFLIQVILFFSSPVFSRSIVAEGFWIKDTTREFLQQIKARPELTVDHVQNDGFELYGPRGLENFLKQNNINYTRLLESNISINDSSGYLSPEGIEKELKSLAKKYPQLSKLYSIGKTEENRDLWVMKLSNNAQFEDNRPEFKYIANMHGNEIVGRELMHRFIKDCLTNYNTDQRIKALLDKFQIHILVSMNPDGAKHMTRGNAKSVDLNRDFPDFDTKDNRDTPDNRAPETQAVMNWQKEHHFKLSANFHGGAEVVNYPWDTVSDLSPVDAIVKDLSLLYASNASYIGASTVFTNGITNGFAWYEVKGGMQDWSIYWRHDLQVTVELSQNKWPKYSTIDYYYEQNRPALISFIEQLEHL